MCEPGLRPIFNSYSILNIGGKSYALHIIVTATFMKYTCVSEPSIDEVVDKLPDSIHLVKVHVGNREYWKDSNCPFRKDRKAHVQSLPTIMRWDGPERLEGADFNNKDIISMAFEEDS